MPQKMIVTALHWNEAGTKIEKVKCGVIEAGKTFDTALAAEADVSAIVDAIHSGDRVCVIREIDDQPQAGPDLRVVVGASGSETVDIAEGLYSPPFSLKDVPTF